MAEKQIRSGQFSAWSGSEILPGGPSLRPRNWEEQDQVGLTWEQIDALDWDWYLWGYGSAGHLEITAVSLSPNPVDCGATLQVSVTVEMVLT